MDKLEADIVKTVDCHDNVILPLEAHAMRMIDREQATTSEQSSHQLSDASTRSNRS